MSSTESLQEKLNRVHGISRGVAMVCVLVAFFCLFVNPEAFYRSYLLGYVYTIGICLGSLALLMVHHLTGGHWGFAIRKILEANTRCLPLMLILFLPIVLPGGMNILYAEWLHAEGDPIIEAKAAYLNYGAWVVRAVILFGVWGTLIWFLNTWSIRQDRTGDINLTRSLRMLSGPGVVLYFLATTVAAWDWGMSLDPLWFSSMYGPLFVISQGLTTLAFCIVVAHWLSRYKPISDVMPKQVYHDIGNLTFAFGVLWAYMSVMQFIIIWSANLPEENPYYLDRSGTGWNLIAVALALFHFAVPFLILLMRHSKLNKDNLIKVAYWILIMRGVDYYWHIFPAFHPRDLAFSPIHIVVPVALLAVYVWYFLGQLKGRPLLPLHDPRYETAPATAEATTHR